MHRVGRQVDFVAVAGDQQILEAVGPRGFLLFDPFGIGVPPVGYQSAFLPGGAGPSVVAQGQGKLPDRRVFEAAAAKSKMLSSKNHLGFGPRLGNFDTSASSHFTASFCVRIWGSQNRCSSAWALGCSPRYCRESRR